jgi:threonine dehydratase
MSASCGSARGFPPAFTTPRYAAPRPVAIDYLEAILNARVYDVAIESPLDEAASLSVRLRNRLLLKREDLQPVFSFNLHGAHDDPDVIAGQGTIGLEVLRRCREPIHAIFVAVGGGGLVGGIAACVKRLRPEVRIVGVEPVDANAMQRLLKAGRRIVLAQLGLFADGVAVRQVG